MKLRRMLLTAGALFLAGCATSSEPVHTEEPLTEGTPTNAGASAPATIQDGIFTREQAIAGEQVAWAACFECHSESEWARSDFLDPWSGRPLGDIYELIRRTMPLGAPGQFSEEEYAAVVAYMLRLQDLPTGDSPLPSDLERLDEIRVIPADGP